MFKKLSLTLCFLPLATFAQFSNMIVFGDSLSDVGNFPESHRIYWHENAPKTLLNAIPQFYVPFANPINTTQKAPKGFSWPVLDARYLDQQTAINGKKRRFRSIGWTEFFLQDKPIVPSHLLSTRKIPNNLSINYAWGYATSYQNCVNPYYQTMTCDEQSILSARKNYVENPSQTNYEKIEIPGLTTQITIFLHDVQTKKVIVDQNTLYTVWIGGNDLLIGAIALQKHHNLLPALSIICGSTAFRVMKNMHYLLKNLRNPPKTIYLFTAFKPGLTPAFYHVPITTFGNFVVHASNFFLRLDATIFNLFSTTKLVIVPIDQWYQTAAQSTQYKKTLGKGCQLNGGDYEDVVNIPKNNCENYLFWNDVHPTALMQAQVAKQLSLMIFRTQAVEPKK